MPRFADTPELLENHPEYFDDKQRGAGTRFL
jgi:hypothetical protein